jgi:hypothetical protein
MARRAEIAFAMMIDHDPIAEPTDYLFQDPAYREQDQARLHAWRNGDWWFVGVRAKAIIRIPHGDNPDCWIVTDLTSPGLWGIESDSGDGYFEDVYREERDVLAGMLDSLTEAHRAEVQP